MIVIGFVAAHFYDTLENGCVVTLENGCVVKKFPFICSQVIKRLREMSRSREFHQMGQEIIMVIFCDVNMICIGWNIVLQGQMMEH